MARTTERFSSATAGSAGPEEASCSSPVTVECRSVIKLAFLRFTTCWMQTLAVALTKVGTSGEGSADATESAEPRYTSCR